MVVELGSKGFFSFKLARIDDMVVDVAAAPDVLVLSDMDATEGIPLLTVAAVPLAVAGVCSEAVDEDEDSPRADITTVGVAVNAEAPVVGTKEVNRTPLVAVRAEDTAVLVRPDENVVEATFDELAFSSPCCCC